MPSLDPVLERVVVSLIRTLRALDVPCCLIGALVPELLLEDKPSHRTNDVDAVVIVPDLPAFDRVREALGGAGFRASSEPYRFQYRAGGRVDLLPYSRAIAPDGKLRLSPSRVLNVAGFDRIAPAAMAVTLDTGDTVPVAPIPLYVLLKLIAFADRTLAKDPASVFHCLRHYAEDDDRRYGLEHAATLVPFEYSTAYLAGRDGQPFLGDDIRGFVTPVLARFVDADDALIDALVRDAGAAVATEEQCEETAEYFRWYRDGLESL
jgi:predicted nucleotidyltransferase